MSQNAIQSYCGNCGTANNANFKYCVSCGHELQKTSETLQPSQQLNIPNLQSADTEVVCSKCHSNQLSANQKGYNTGAAVAGSLINGGSGIGLGMAGSEEIRITCLSCGHKFRPGDGSLKKVDAQGNITYEKQVFVDKAGNRWRNCSLIALIVLILFVLFVWSWIKSMIH
jgi:Zn ribbon nucleic-acid-binding protein